jgi:putative phosphoesterase
MLKIGIISDIHGNYTALQTALDELQREGISNIVCLGDVLEGGPQPMQVLQKLKDLNIPVIAGNADEEVLEVASPRSYKTDFERKLHEIDRWILNHLTLSDIGYVRSFKQSIEIDLGEAKSLIGFHGSPRSNMEGIFPTTSEDELAEFLKNTKNTVIGCGRTHVPMFRIFLESTIVNPGSVGMPFLYATVEAMKRKDAYNPAFSEFAVLSCTKDGGLGIQLRRIPVDLEVLRKAIKESGIPHAEFVAKDWKCV